MIAKTFLCTDAAPQSNVPASQARDLVRYDMLQAAIASGSGGKFAYTFPDGINTSFNIPHNLASQDVIVQVRKSTAPQDVIVCNVTLVDLNNVLLSGWDTPPASGSLRVVIRA